MMNKKIERIKNTSKSSVFSYELSKLKSNYLILFSSTVMIQLLTFAFFTLVGKFDISEDTISSFQGIVALSNTVSMCAFSIVGSVLLRKELVRFYIGEHRNRLFLFPVDRKELLVKKNASFQIMSFVSFGAGLIVALMLEIMANLLLGFGPSGVVLDLTIGLVSAFISCLLVYSILTYSEMIAIWKQSEIATVVSAVVLMLLFSNLSAMGIMHFPFVTLVITVIMSVMTALGFNKFAASIKDMEDF